MIEADELLAVPLFASAVSSLRERIAARSAEIVVAAGDWLTREGDPAYFWTLLSGEVERVRYLAGKETQATTFDPGEFFGEFPVILGTEQFGAMRALRPSRLMRTDPADFYMLISESREAAAIIAQTLTRRLTFLREAYNTYGASQITLIGNRLDPACHDVRDFLSRNQIAFEWLDLEDPLDADEIAARNVDVTRCPVVLLPEGRRLIAPDHRTLALALGLSVEPLLQRYDVAIIGGGPAGLAAALYGGSEGLATILIEQDAPGGQAGTSSRIENYLGFVTGISGGELAHRALDQAKRLGAEIIVTRSVCEIRSAGDAFDVRLDGGGNVQARSIVLATGVAWRKLGVPGLDQLVGRGVFYGASRGEAHGLRGRDIFLIGGGNSAGQAAMFFAPYARSVTILVRGDGLARTMSQYLIDQLQSQANITVEAHTTLAAVRGEGQLEGIVTRSSSEGLRERPAQALFIFIGADAQTSWLPAGLERDARGFVRTGRDIEDWHLERKPYPLETSIPGIFAAGDVRSTSVKRVASSVGEGSMVIAYIHQYLELAP